MVKRYPSFVISGKRYSESQLLEHCARKLSSTLKTNWEWKLFQFISQWLVQPESITAKTSGTTGKPKEIQISKEKIIHSAMQTIRYLKVKPNDLALLCLSSEHIAGKMMVVRAFTGNLNLVPVEPASNPLKSIAKNQTIDFAAFVPMQINEIIAHKPSRKKFEQIRNVIIGGAPLSKVLRQRLKKMQNNIYETYGMTETVSHIALKRISKPDTSYFETLEDISVSTDKRGCLVINTPYLSPKPIVTNDIVELMDRHHFKWLGRFDNVVNSGGIKLIPESLEEKIRNIMDADYFFAGIPDNKLGEKLVMVIQKPADVSKLSELKIRLSKVLGKYETPKKFLFTKKFVRSAEGKLKRKETLKRIIESQIS